MSKTSSLVPSGFIVSKLVQKIEHGKCIMPYPGLEPGPCSKPLGTAISNSGRNPDLSYSDNADNKDLSLSTLCIALNSPKFSTAKLYIGSCEHVSVSHQVSGVVSYVFIAY
jgi:hypothetical protein